MFTGIFLCMKDEIPEMVKAGAGANVNTASGASLVGYPGTSDYVAAKHGVSLPAPRSARASIRSEPPRAWDAGRRQPYRRQPHLLAVGRPNPACQRRSNTAVIGVRCSILDRRRQQIDGHDVDPGARRGNPSPCLLSTSRIGAGPTFSPSLASWTRGPLPPDGGPARCPAEGSVRPSYIDSLSADPKRGEA
jgi:hypothetical protein